MTALEELRDLLPPCSQCGNRFTEPACGFAHVMIQGNPFAHNLLTAALAEAGLENAIDARSAALDEAADAWTQGAWADAPRRPDRVVERIATAQHVGNWLRDRARAIRTIR